MSGWQSITLGELLHRSDEAAVPDPDAEYHEVTIKLWGKGGHQPWQSAWKRCLNHAHTRRFVRANQLVMSKIYARNGAIRAPMRRFLEKNGVPAYTLDLEPVYAGIDDYLPVLAARIEAVCAQTGARQLAIVANSMGGLAARAYLRAQGPGRVAAVKKLVLENVREIRAQARDSASV